MSYIVNHTFVIVTVGETFGYKRLQEIAISAVFRPDIHQKFTIIDQKTVWYGSINLLSYGRDQESIMRIESVSIVNELLRSIESSV